MKLKNKFKFAALGATLAAPIIALPLINAVKPVVNKGLTAITTKKINVTEKSYYTVRFEQYSRFLELGDVAVMHEIHIDDNDIIDMFDVPATITADNGKTYNLAALDCTGRCTGHGLIKCFSLKNARNLREIANHCFTPDTFKIGFIDFTGAAELRYIREYAFANQWFNSSLKINNNVLDLSRTKLEKIEPKAFYEAADSNQNKFEALILPPTIKSIDSESFSCRTEKCRMLFDKIIYTDPNPPEWLFYDGIPHLIDPNSQRMVVPFGSKQKYIKLPKFDRKYKDCLHESTIRYGDTIGTRGSLRITCVANQSGVDTNDWFPVDKNNKKQTNCKLWLSNNNEGKLFIDSKGFLHWKNLAPGEYKTRVYAAKYDDAEGKTLSAVASDEITISVIKPTIMGTPNVWATIGTEDSAGPWEVNLGTEGKTHPIKKVTWSGHAVSPNVNVSVKNVDGTNKGQMVWGTEVASTDGIYSVILCANVEDDWAENTYKIYEEVFLHVGEIGQINVKYKIGTGTPASYAGEEIKLSTGQTVTFQLDLPQTFKTYTPSKPELSIDGITVTDPVNPGDPYTFDVSAESLGNGLHTFTVHSTVSGGGAQYDLYAPYNIKISINQDSRVLPQTPERIDIVKTTTGSTSYKVVKNEGDVITSLKVKPAPWHKDDTRVGKYVSFEIDPNDKQSVLVNWASAYSPLGNPYDYLDVELDMEITPKALGETRKVHQAVSLVATNTSEVIYDGEKTMIDVCPGDSVTSEAPFIFKLNGAISGYNTAQWGIDCENTALKNCISLTGNNADPTKGDYVYLTCNLSSTQAKQVPQGIHEVTVYAYDEDNLTANATTIQLNVNYTVSILDVPSKIETTVGKAGKSAQPLITKLGKKVVSDAEYKVEGLGESVTVDEEGYINWIGNIPAGTHQLSLTSSVRVGMQVYSTTTFFTLEVAEAGKSNTGAIVGGTVGGTVAAGGAATGITLGVRKHKFVKGKKK